MSEPSEGPEVDLVGLRSLAEKARIAESYSEGWADYIAAVSPDVLLALLAEIEQLRAWRNGCAGSCEAGSLLLDGVWVAPEGD